MIVATVVDEKKCYVVVPDDSEPEDYYKGIIVGPPDLSNLNLPYTLEVKLNNELFVRGLITQKDVATNRQEVLSALQSALLVDVEKIVRCYDA